MAALVHSHSSLLSDGSPVLPTESNHNVTQFTVYSVQASATDPLIIPASSVHLSTYNNTFESLCRSNLKPYCMGRKAAFFFSGHLNLRTAPETGLLSRGENHNN